MGHGIANTNLDFIFGLKGQGKDWHGLTIEKDGPLHRDMFPIHTPAPLSVNGKPTPWEILMSDDFNGEPAYCGQPFDPNTFGYILPQQAMAMVEEALEGTSYTVERLGMLWDRSFWFVSVSLDELKEVSRPGELFRLNFSGGFDRANSPQGELSNIRAVCWNTISYSRMTGERLFRVKQSANSKAKLDAAKADVERAVGMAKIFNVVMADMEAKPASEDEAVFAYAGELSRAGADFTIKTKDDGTPRQNKARNTVGELVELFKTGDGNQGSTRADVLNGFTQLFTRGRKDTTKSPWRAIASSEFQGNATRKAEFASILSDDKQYKKLVAEGKSAWKS